MKIKQVSVFLENKTGRLLEALSVLERSGINIRALSIADTTEFGILRLIVSDPDKAAKALKKANFSVGENEVLAVEIPDRPGGLAGVLRVLKNAAINVEYIYAFVEKSGRDAVVVIRTENLAAAARTLKKGGVKVIASAKVYRL
jgi:hypothetical protein